MGTSNKSCPSCHAELDFELRLHQSSYSFDITVKDSVTEIVRAALLRYWRWKAEGMLPHWGYSGDSKPHQFYYDMYHDAVGYDAEKKEYSFSIQTRDSPEGDTWINGTFKIETALEIVDLKYESSFQ